MNAEGMERFYTNLSVVLGTSLHNAHQLIHRFNSIKYSTLTNLFNRLPTAVVVTPPSDPVFAPAADETFYSNGEDVSGEWGIVYTDRILPFAYKVFFTGPFNKQGYSDETCRMAYLKALFKEVIIQTFLQTDRDYGHHI